MVAFILRHLMRMDGPATADDFGLDRNVDSADNASRKQDEIYDIVSQLVFVIRFLFLRF